MSDENLIINELSRNENDIQSKMPSQNSDLLLKSRFADKGDSIHFDLQHNYETMPISLTSPTKTALKPKQKLFETATIDPKSFEITQGFKRIAASTIRSFDSSVSSSIRINSLMLIEPNPEPFPSVEDKTTFRKSVPIPKVQIKTIESMN